MANLKYIWFNSTDLRLMDDHRNVVDGFGHNGIVLWHIEWDCYDLRTCPGFSTYDYFNLIVKRLLPLYNEYK